jgi:hypothetical protein
MLMVANVNQANTAPFLANSALLVWDNDKSVAESRGIVERMMTNPELGALMVSAGVRGMPKFWVAD